MDRGIFVHVVTYNSAKWIRSCLDSLLSQEECVLGRDLFIHVTDNHSSDDLRLVLAQYASHAGVSFEYNEKNIGFCGGHNQGAKRFLESSCRYFLILNPDIKLDPCALQELRSALETDSACGSATPKLFRADDSLNPSQPRRLDAAGMELVSSLRHFDRGSECSDTYQEKEYVFGGTGACVMYTRSAVESLLLKGDQYDADKLIVHPELSYKEDGRVPLFDEAFFAYREDADLAWRAQLLGFRCVFVPSAVGYHRRVVLPHNRKQLSPELNGYSVRNRFLLQLNNYFWNNSITSILGGVFIRNVIVIVGAFCIERSSVRYLLQPLKLYKRAMERRRLLRKKITHPSKII